MEKTLKAYLQILNSDECWEKPNEAEIILNKISECFSQENSKLGISLLINLVLDEKNGIFIFIWKAAANAKMNNSLTSVFKLLNLLVVDFKKLTEPHFSILFEKCLFLLDAQLAKVKELALGLIETLISTDCSVAFDISSLAKKLKTKLRYKQLQETVTKAIYSVVGIILAKYPETIKNSEKWFYSSMVTCLWKELKLKKASAYKIKGALKGLDGYLLNYCPPSNESSGEIYGFIQSVINKDNEMICQSAIKIFHNHWIHFAKFVSNDRNFWKEKLTTWIKRDIKYQKLAFRGFQAFYQIIIFVTKENLLDCQISKEYVKEFVMILQSENSNLWEKKSALVGIKLFVATNFFNNEVGEMYQVLQDLVQKQEPSVSYALLPLCIECISTFVFKFTTDQKHLLLINSNLFETDPLACLQRLSLKIINHYPKIDVELQLESLVALEKSFYMLGLCNLQILETHLNKIIYQGLISSCSLMTQLDLELLQETTRDEIDWASYKCYLSLWKHFLNLANSSNSPVNESFVLKKGVAVKVFDAYMNSFMKIIKKLNFNVKKTNSDAELERPRDLQIFMNAVDLYYDVTTQTDGFMLSKWMNEVFQSSIEMAYRYPLVAGFYKIITATLKSSESIQFFEDCFERDNKFKSFEVVSKFLEKLLLKLNQFKNDLQIVCLQTLLAASASLIEAFIQKIIPALQVAIYLGRRYLPLLEDLFKALEKWNSSLSSYSMRYVMKKISPDLYVLFRNFSFQETVYSNGKHVKEPNFEYNKLIALQKKFLLLLGKLEISTVNNLVNVFENTEEEGRKLNDKSLIYGLPYHGLVIGIRLDEMLPLITELSFSCTERHKRIATCELLHSIAIIILGNINQLNGGFTTLFKKVIRICFVLACDSDAVVFQIFEPLMIQIMHYFSEKKASNFSETQDLINILMDFVSRPYHSSERDFAALLIREFTVSCIKQHTQEELKAIPEGLQKIIDQIFNLSLHPSYNKRKGGAIVFNEIYSVLREEEYVLHVYWFLLFYHLMESLKMSSDSEDVTEIVEAINNVKILLIEKSEEFNDTSPSRIVPPEFEGNLLVHLVKWTLKICCCEKTSLRRTAMSVVEDLSPVVHGCDSLTSFVRIYFAGKSFEVECNFPIDDFNNWLNHHSCLFETYTWLLKEKVITSEEVFKFNFNSISKTFVRGLFTDNQVLGNENVKRESVFSYLNLLKALKNKAFYFVVEIWQVIKICVFNPSALGFNINDSLSSEALFLVLVDLLQFFKIELCYYHWNHFYKNAESLLHVPVLGYITRNQYIDLRSSEFLFSLKLIYQSGLWDCFMKRMVFSLNGNLIVDKVFRSLFFKEGKILYAVALEPFCKNYLEDLLKLALNVGVDFNDFFNYTNESVEVREEETQKLITKGEYFQLLFKSVIYDFMNAKSAFLVDLIVENSEIKNLQYLSTIFLNKNSEDKRTKLAREVIQRWKEFEKAKIPAEPERNQALLSLAAIAPDVIGDPGCLKNSKIADFIFLKDIIYSNEIECISNMLPFLSDFAEVENDRLESFMQKLLKKKEKENFSIILKGLLKSLKSTGSLIVLRCILKVPSSFFKNWCEEVKIALSVFGSISAPHLRRVFNLVYDACFRTMDTSFTIKFIYDTFLTPLINLLPGSKVYDLILSYLESIYDIIFSPASVVSVTSNDADIAKKICAAKTLQKFMEKITEKELSVFPKEKKHLINNVVKNSFNFLKGQQPLTLRKENYRKFMCEIFNAICTIISTLSADEKIYKLFIFDERGSFLYRAIDPDVEYSLQMDFDEIPKRKKFITSLRKSLSSETRFNSAEPLDSLKYIQTDTLFSSSLGEDVTKFDFTRTPIRHLSGENSTVDHVEVNLEVDCLNNHECMVTLVGVISKMVNEKITPKPEEENSAGLPCWLQFFLKLLTNDKASVNLKLFTLKALYNVQEYVKPYSESVFSIVLKSVAEIFCNSKLNYFFIDLIEMMTKWKCIPERLECKKILTDLIISVIDKSPMFQREVLKYNLEVIKLMVETWRDGLLKPCFAFVSKRLYECLENVNNLQAHYEKVYLYVQTCGILLTNKIPPWTEGSEEKFFRLISEYFSENNKSYERCAEVCGLALNYLEKTRSERVKKCEKLICEKISSQSSNDLTLIYGVCLHYPKIVYEFAYKIFISAWSKVDSFTVKKLEMLLIYAKECDRIKDNTFEIFAQLFLTDQLALRDLAVQEITLEIINNLAEKIELNKYKILVTEALKLKTDTNPKVRKWVYLIAIKYILKNQVCHLTEQCTVVLLKGLQEGVAELEGICLKFWLERLKIGSENLAFVTLLRSLYTAETEHLFLSNAVKILMASNWDSRPTLNSIFSHPIAQDSSFEKRDLILGIRETSTLNLFFNQKGINQSLEHVASLKNSSLLYGNLKVKSSAETGFNVLNANAKTGEYSLENPMKKRFCKKKPENYYLRTSWQERKKREFFEEEDSIGSKSDVITIFGEYKSGYYPNIQISHSQVLKPLEILSREDHSIAREFLISFYSGFIESISRDERIKILRETNEFFKMVLKTSSSFDPGLIGFIFRIILKYCSEFDIDCKLISNSAILSNWLSLGILIIEEIISKKERAELKEIKSKNCAHENDWLELARVYRHLQESDVLYSIFIDKMKVSAEAKDALHSEALRDWVSSSKSYRLAIENDPDSETSEFFTESYLRCLAKLSDWSSLNGCIRKTVDNDLDKLFRNYYFLSWFLRSEMIMSLDAKESNFQMVMKEFSKNKINFEFIESNFQEEMAVYDWLTGKIQCANYRLSRFFLNFLTTWPHQNKWCANLMKSKLIKLQSVAELSHVFESFAEDNKFRLNENIKAGIELWKNNLPSAKDNLIVWDVKLTYRKKFLEQLTDFDLRSSEIKSNFAIVEAALCQNNLSLARKYLRRIKGKLNENDEEMRIEFDYLKNLEKMTSAKIKMTDGISGLKLYVSVWQQIPLQIAKILKTETEFVQIYLYRCNAILGKLVSEILPFVVSQSENPEVVDCVLTNLDIDRADPVLVIKELKEKGLKYLENAKNISETFEGRTSEISRTYLEITKFLLEFSDLKKVESFEKVAKFLLKSMAFGNREARRMFGCLLRTSQFVPNLTSLSGLETDSDSVPSWMFLMWTNQILASLNTELYFFLKPIVLRMVQDYPNALRYPFKLSKENYEFENIENKVFLQQLNTALLSDKVYENFLTSVKFLASPDLILKFHLQNMLKEVEQANWNFTKTQTILMKLYNLMFSPSFDLFRGTAFRCWALLKSPLDNLKTLGLDRTAWIKNIHEILQATTSLKVPSKRVLSSLKSYSPWLYNFHALKIDTTLELPGQYDGEQEPLEKDRVLITSFKSEVITFNTKCMPMRITILGNDAIEHKFLVKFTEDLRQDERIQQLFKHFNYELRELPSTETLSIDTYKVVPLHSNLGMIEWVENTLSLYEIFAKALGDEGKSIAKAQLQHCKDLGQNLRSESSLDPHLNAYENMNRDSAILVFNKRIHDFPQDLLKKSFIDLSTTPEHFIHLRKNFATSHAVMSITHWLVGVGDRHLQNTLISTSTGRVLGVDFGCAFGFATQFLTPPELVPFRLTPQILNLLNPLRESGWIKQTMIHSLRTFRKAKLILSSVLEVFVLEPVINWLEHAKKNIRCSNDLMPQWRPSEKIVIVMQKLSGMNPILTFEMDLKAGHSQSKYLKNYLQVLKGVTNENIRATLKKTELSEEEQVDCLIDLATDPHVLAKTYVGWSSWL